MSEDDRDEWLIELQKDRAHDRMADLDAEVAQRDAEIERLNLRNKRLRKALTAMLVEFDEDMAGIVHDELAVIAQARQALRGDSDA